MHRPSPSVLWILLGILFLQTPRPAQGDAAPGQTPFRFEQANLDALFKQLHPLVEAELGSPGRAIKLRLASAPEVHQALVEENRVILGHQLDAPELVENSAQALAEALTPILLAKYALGSGEILVLEENFGRLARALKLPELQSPEVLRAVILHELVHAFDDAQHGMGKTLLQLEAADRIKAMNAVIEGHAQHVARRISKQQGWLEGFESFNRAILASPIADPDSAEAYVQRVQSSTLTAYYLQGEKFIDAIAAAAGQPAVVALLKDPPTDMAVIYEPAWALDPSLRPALVYDAAPALTVALADHTKEAGWIQNATKISKAQLLAGISILGEGIGKQAIHSLRNAQARVALRQGPEASQVILALLEFPSPGEAKVFFELNRATLRAKKEILSSQGVKLLSDGEEAIEQGGLVGLLSRRRLEVSGEEMSLITLLGHWESLNVEFTWIGLERETPAIVEQTLACLERSKLPRAPAPGH